MESKSRIYTSPSFNTHSSNNIADIADRVVQELRTQNRFNDGDDDFSFSDDDNQTTIEDEVNTNTHTETVNQTEDDQFEFPAISESGNESISHDQISPRYPVFDTSLLSNVDSIHCKIVDDEPPNTDSKPPPSRRASLMKLFKEDHDTSSPSTSASSSEADEVDGVTPGTYCVWKPKTKAKSEQRGGKHKKSNSISIDSTSNQWKVRDLLKRSYSDDNYSVGKDSPVFLLFHPISPEKEKKVDKSGKTVSSKPEKRIPAYKSKIGNIRLPPYLPYRQDQVAAFANFDGANRNQYRF